MNLITCDQLRAAAFPYAGLVRVCETHLSFVVLTGEIAYKVKKALELDFIDTSSLQRRLELCEEELRLNRRFAADIYLGVVPIVVVNGRLAFEAAGTPIEYAVKMRQFEERQEMQALLRRKVLTEADLAALGERIASIHADADVLRDADQSQSTDHFVRKVRENLASMSDSAALIDGVSQVSDLIRWTETSLQDRRDEFVARERDGFIRECHGDLHTGNIVRWNGQLTAFDAIEFDENLRFIDVLNDAAFLWMDLVSKNHTEQAFAFLNRYLECTGDYRGLCLLPFYSVYRALVRAKVALISIQQRQDETAHADNARAFLSCASNLSKKCRPLLVVMHGASGSGKSWLSGQLVPTLPAVRIRSDLERKRLAGINAKDLLAKAPQHVYSHEFNERTYAHLLECARSALCGGLNVIIDAAFLKRHERLTFAKLAREVGATLSIVSCEADPQTLSDRIARRNADLTDPSDADEKVMLRQLQTMEPFALEETGCLFRVDTRAADAISQTLQHLRNRLSS